MTTLKPLDLNAAARDQYGPSASAVLTGNHLWDWAASYNGQRRPLDMNRAARTQYGDSYYAAYRGNHAYDWGAIDMARLGYKVLPILLVPYDLFHDIDQVRQAVARYYSNVQAARAWYGQHNGKTFQLLDPLACWSDRSSDQWDYFCYQNTLEGQENKEKFLNEVARAFDLAYPFRGENLRLPICVYTGLDTDDFNGAFNRGRYGAIPPRCSAVTIDMANLPAGSLEADALHTLIHELGHSFGLPHPADRNPRPGDFQLSFMQGTWPPHSIVLDVERAELAKSRYFNV